MCCLEGIKKGSISIRYFYCAYHVWFEVASKVDGHGGGRKQRKPIPFRNVCQTDRTNESTEQRKKAQRAREKYPFLLMHIYTYMCVCMCTFICVDFFLSCSLLNG